MSNLIFEVNMNINVQRNYKNLFISEYLIPSLKQNRKNFQDVEMYYCRRVIGGPVITIFIYAKEEIFHNIYAEFNSIFDDFCEEYKDSFKENDIYMKQKEDLIKMNNLKNTHDPYVNYTISYHQINSIPRNGEYVNEEHKRIVNKWLFDNSGLIEETFLELGKMNEIDKYALITCIFLFTSYHLDNETPRGYMSFKSHYLGFMNSRRKHQMEVYDQKIKDIYMENKDVFKEIPKLYTNPLDTNILSNQNSRWLLEQWKEALESFMFLQEDLTIKKKYSSIISMLKFRKLSKFHNEAFSFKNLSFYLSPQFQKYRNLVNLLYICLPNVGINTPIRLLSSLVLVQIMEEE
ncbi:hypothetical protein [Lysinibacillus xylanilyticus]|uniref:hypothetical protein n=1 Tax=Lysinibacillus xylanilyticus TaxID=582475 RepID=UPI0038091ABE